MFKKSLLGKILIVILLISSVTIITQNFMFASAQTATQLKIFIGPTNIPADNSVCECIAVQLQDSKGNPARAQKDIQIDLSSSLINVGQIVESAITIKQGSTYATANFQSTFTPGTTTIFASATGYTTVQGQLTTTGPVPTALVVYGFPSLLPADGRSYDGAIVVQLQDSNGVPAKAPSGGVTAILSSSNSAIGTVDETITINGGDTYAVATFTTTMKAGTTSITAAASGYTSKQATFTTQVAVTSASILKIYIAPPKVPSEHLAYRQVAVMLQDATGKIAQLQNDVSINLVSSKEDIGSIDQTITVQSGEPFATANFQTTYKSGATTITATATDFKTAEATITTVGTVPSKLAVYSIPPSVPADGKSYNTIRVQLQDSSGKPAKDPNGDVTVNIFSSNLNAGDVSPKELTIPFGKTHASATFISALEANITNINAQATGYTNGQTKITTYLIDQMALDIVVKSSPSMIKPGETANITAYVTYGGIQPASGATIVFSTTTKNASSFSKVTYMGDGYYTAKYTAPKTPAVANYTIIANATKTGYTIGVANTTLIVNANPNATVGMIRINVNQDGNPISDASVTSITQPNGAQTLNGISNQTGDVVFMNTMAGTYTIKITKDGYEPIEQTLALAAGQTLTRSIALTQSFSPLIIIVVVVIAIIATLLAVFIIRKRKNHNDDFKKRVALGFIPE